MPKRKRLSIVLGEGVSGIVYRKGPLAVKVRKDPTCTCLVDEAAALRKLRRCELFQQPIRPKTTLPSRLVFKYAGVSIRDTILSEASAGRVATLVIRALAHCHSVGLFHADIKPCNVLYLAGAPAGHEIRVIDLGNSVSEDELPFCSETTSPAFRAPWRATEFGCQGTRAAMRNGDLFSAAILFVALRTPVVECHVSMQAQLRYFEAAIGPFPPWYAARRPDWFSAGRVVGTVHPVLPFAAATTIAAVRTSLAEMLSFEPWHAPADTTAFEDAFPDNRPLAWP
jgi:serine/threonine protein kinase